MARKLFFMRPHRLKLVVTILTGVVVLFASHQLMLPPNLVPVAFLTAAVPAQAAIPASDIQWVATDHPPAGVLTQAQAGLLQTLVIDQALPAGATIPVSAMTPPGNTSNLSTYEVPWNVGVSGPLSGYLTLGGRVSIWAPSSQGGSPVEIAQGARIIGLYNSAGAPMTPAVGGAGALPASASMAVPQADLQSLLGLTNVTLEPNSPARHFILVNGSASSATSSTSSGFNSVPSSSSSASPSSSSPSSSSSSSSAASTPASSGSSARPHHATSRAHASATHHRTHP